MAFYLFYDIYILVLIGIQCVNLGYCQLPIKAIDEENIPRLDNNSHLKPNYVDQVPGCIFGNVFYTIGESWIPDLGPPFGVMFCVKCQCVLKAPYDNNRQPIYGLRKVTTMIKCHNFKSTCPVLNCGEEPIKVLGKCCEVCRPKLWSIHGQLALSLADHHPYVALPSQQGNHRGGNLAFFNPIPSASTSLKTSFRTPAIWQESQINKTGDKNDGKSIAKQVDQVQGDDSFNNRPGSPEYIELYALLTMELSDEMAKFWRNYEFEEKHMVNGIVGRAYIILERDYLYLTIRTVGLENPLVILIRERHSEKVLYEMAVQKLTKNFDGEFLYTKICAYITDYQSLVGSLEKILDGSSILTLKFNQYGYLGEISGPIVDHRFIKTESFASILIPEPIEGSGNQKTLALNGGGLMVMTKGYYDHSTIDFLIKFKSGIERKNNMNKMGFNVLSSNQDYHKDYLSYGLGNDVPNTFENINIKFVWHRKFAVDIPFIPLKEISGYIDTRSGEFASSWTSVPKHAMRLISSGNVKIVIHIGRETKLTGVVFPKSTCSSHYTLLSGFDAYPMTHEGAGGVVAMKLEDNGQMSYKIKLVGIDRSRNHAISIQPYSHRRRNVNKRMRDRAVIKLNYDANSSLTTGSIPFIPFTVIHLLIHNEFYINVENDIGQNVLSGPIELVHFGGESFETLPTIITGSGIGGVKSPAAALLWLKLAKPTKGTLHLPSKIPNQAQKSEPKELLTTDSNTICNFIEYKVKVAGFTFERVPTGISNSAIYQTSSIRLVMRKLLTSEHEGPEEGPKEKPNLKSFIPQTTNFDREKDEMKDNYYVNSYVEITGLEKNLAMGLIRYPQSNDWCQDLKLGNAFFQIITKAFPEGEIGAQVFVSETQEEMSSSNNLAYNSFNLSQANANQSSHVVREFPIVSPPQIKVEFGDSNNTSCTGSTIAKWVYYSKECKKCQCRNKQLYCSEIENSCGENVCQETSEEFIAKCCSPREITKCEFPKGKSINEANDMEIKGCVLGDITHAVNSRWHPHVPPFGIDNCVSCLCNEKLEVVCKRISCPLVTCPLNKAIYSQGSCCKVCKNNESQGRLRSESHSSDSKIGNDFQKDSPTRLDAGSCFYQNREYTEGQKFHPKFQAFGRERGIFCVCRKGKWKCRRQRCKKKCITRSKKLGKIETDCCSTKKNRRRRIKVCNATSLKNGTTCSYNLKKRVKNRRRCQINKNETLNATGRNMEWANEKGNNMKNGPKCRIKGNKRRKNRKNGGKKRKKGKQLVAKELS